MNQLRFPDQFAHHQISKSKFQKAAHVDRVLCCSYGSIQSVRCRSISLCDVVTKLSHIVAHYEDVHCQHRVKSRRVIVTQARLNIGVLPTVKCVMCV